MTDDIISRQAAIAVLGKIFPADPMRNDYTKGITCGAALATEYIKQLPSAQPQRKSACLIAPNPYGKCSNCGQLIDIRDEYNYCPNCGAHIKNGD